MVRTDGGDGASEPNLVANAPRAYHVYYDSSAPYSLNEVIIEAVAAIQNTDPTDDPIPLTDALDPDALDSLFAATHQGTERNSGHVKFQLSGLDVFVHANGHILIRERVPGEDPGSN